MPPAIRPALARDAVRLVPLLAELRAMDEDLAFDAARRLRGLELLAASAGACVLVAEECGAAVGMCTGRLVVSTAEGGPGVLVEDIVVTATHRGRGLGRSLPAHIARWGAGRGATRMQLPAGRADAPAPEFRAGRDWNVTDMICLRTNELRTTEAHS